MPGQISYTIKCILAYQDLTFDLSLDIVQASDNQEPSPKLTVTIVQVLFI